ncbi:MAG: 30S ribosomal protein S4 [Tistrella sp.]|jgi:small subunit ribosomal protein S4|uniref:Small ribosomal subunit protein uS4 n=1 Tax=Tistrella mobilis TaxID=171437 RepID=A0A161QYH1_9PROT|nr:MULTISPECIES: 30S ribosomal protein S4 [Tistrella]KYO49706.1 30S ribosomal protein S4 [Tistrella mobilis]MAD39470.1 30S ribosomal protein S4 [Tistrella sp.]MAM75343.1 30S ribosomal protein S4 [Tistrella sp.]MBA74815.1 30S ribosomal protein S4 [Tistrella sp.]
MTKRIQAKHKISRRLGVNLWGTAKSPVNARSYGPGQHGQRRRKPSDYGLQLAAKQQLKGYYGNLTEKQFRRVVEEATRRKGESTENLIGLLESRLDAVVYRSNFVATVFAARQFINHGHVAVNGRRVTIPSYRLKPGDVVSVREKSRQLTFVLEATQRREREVPEYIDVDFDKLTATYNRMPQLAEVPYPVQMDPKQIIEYYSR